MENKTYEIYYGWKIPFISLDCVILGALAIASAIIKQWAGFQEILIGICGVVFILAALAVLIYYFYSRISKMPVLIIGDDRVKMHAPLKGGYSDVEFEDVDDFELFSLNGNKMIAIKYNPAGYRKLMDKSNGANQALVKFNTNKIGAAGNLNASNLTMTSTDICELLKERLNNYQKLHNA